jgi:hypothetical protein
MALEKKGNEGPPACNYEKGISSAKRRPMSLLNSNVFEFEFYL